MKTPTRKVITAFSMFLAALFILAQFVFQTIGSAGAWCSPSLDAPRELGHSSYEYFAYGFPLPFLDVVMEGCFEGRSTTYKWSPIGLVVDGFVLALIAYPAWSYFLRKRSTDQEPKS
jgi:hypothetical protein